MDSSNRIFHYMGKLTLKKSRVLREGITPKEDSILWFFLIIGDNRFTFFYKIEEPLIAIYEQPFDIQMSFIMDDMDKIIEINKPFKK